MQKFAERHSRRIIMPKKIVNVWFNHGRWIVRCPKCGSKTEIKPKSKKKNLIIKYYCGSKDCHPGKIKRVLKRNINGELSYNYSRTIQMQAAKNAYNSEEIYEAVFPEDWVKAEELLRLRLIKHQGYRPHEILKRTGKPEIVADLAWENEHDSKLGYLKEKIKVESPTDLPAKSEIVEQSLPDGLYGELQ